ncbi:uncharacterized protein PGTG_18939 [Puccinia graminis f. sp. tritici CRL 75-36-700-3]|uniref:Uncharacterized protein n=1 Tax=Puccinia graminis f. sp. tritici (strain CRL 75-36-700-3 / race SCCL) TaxID=418459 RepID=E3LAF0_PUCGT|nr:uncharacterized protein PGTG_18939 [Puccinia graminis f. sp. tritici CRL 75-36-700-3]EFP93525.2 hypothetical protein PGTG_18939 [Puccinia graminis f. sp. tritici CRL 75-36-700-3]
MPEKTKPAPESILPKTFSTSNSLKSIASDCAKSPGQYLVPKTQTGTVIPSTPSNSAPCSVIEQTTSVPSSSLKASKKTITKNTTAVTQAENRHSNSSATAKQQPGLVMVKAAQTHTSEDKHSAEFNCINTSFELSFLSH